MDTMTPHRWPGLVALALLTLPLLSVIECGKDKITVDHLYYNMTLYQKNQNGMFHKHYVDVSPGNGGKTHEFLSNHSQAAEAVSPGFDFPFYGHNVDLFFVTTHGFLSFAPRLHNLMYKTQYIAPLRVKFDPSQSPGATIDYLSSPDKLTVQWTNVTVARPFQHPNGGNFTFQVTLFKNGDVVFVYIQIPELLTSDALYDKEPVAGLSDAFLLGDSELHVYHTLNVEPRHINSKTVVVFRAKPTCIRQQNCQDCSALRQHSEFDCVWCSQIRRCSDGADRLREHWDSHGCGATNTSSEDQCPSHTEWRSSVLGDDVTNVEAVEDDSGLSGGVVASIVISTVLVVILLGLVTGFVYVYGRSNPGGLAERIALRLEANYKRFGLGDLSSGGLDDMSGVEMSRTPTPPNEEGGTGDLSGKHLNNNNSITVNF